MSASSTEKRSSAKRHGAGSSSESAADSSAGSVAEGAIALVSTVTARPETSIASMRANELKRAAKSSDA